jgi:dihydrofolate synthase/folylpolyglutamate synthase
MSYLAAIDQLNAMVPELHTLSGQPHRKFSLDEVRVLLAALGDPQKRFPSVLIAGTNGKGSTASTLASILTASGLEVGLYTSPHLECVNERIRIGSAEIADEAFAGLYFRVHDTAQKLVREGKLPQLPSFFEILTAQALLYFAEAGVQIAVLEVGMGGRLDATNVVDPLLSVITDISLDHTEWLGSTIAAIAREKAGILRPGGTLIALPQHPEADRVLGEVAVELRVRCVNAADYMPNIPLTGAIAVGPYRIEALGKLVEVNSPLAGSHQKRNVALAIAAAVELAGEHGFPVTPAAIAAGIRDTNWPGRLERFEIGGVEWILDVAHNSAGAWALQAGLGGVLGDKRSRTLIFSCLRDKPLAEMARILFPQFDRVIFAPLHSARAAAMDDLLAAACATGTHAVAADSVAQALGLAEERAKQSVGGGVVVVSGSVYLVGEARGCLVSRKEVQL